MTTAWRISRAADDETIVALSTALFREDPAPRSVPPEFTRATLARYRAEPTRGRALVLETDARCVGYCLLASFWSNELGGEICVMDELYVTPAHRGLGHGRRLLTALSEGSELWGRQVVAFDLEVTPGNARARAFYESLGFRLAKNVHLRNRLNTADPLEPSWRVPHDSPI